ncbi:hypothetical protein BH10PSE13_BH10PSE13_14730 [soil metagenome]
MSTVRAFGILAIVAIVVGLYLGLTKFLGIHEYWAGFLFLLQWSMMEQTKLQAIPRSALGAATGIAIACVGIWLAPIVGAPNAAIAQILASAVAVFLLIRQLVGLFVNAATMLFLTVMTIPQVAAGTTPFGCYIGLSAGVVFFGGLALAAAGVSRLKSAGKASRAVA